MPTSGTPTELNGGHINKTKAASSKMPELELPNAEVGMVRLRFAPEPNGFLHIGHSKAGLLNKDLADKYEGSLIVRMDDTNPAKESTEFVDSLLKDIDTLGIKYSDVTYTSDYFPQLMDMAEKLISEGKAYVDDTPVDQMRTERNKGIESKSRNNSVSRNMELWKEMIAGSERGGMCCLRGKLDFQNPNKCLRDPVYYRCNPVHHHRVGSQYKVYPTYDFASPFVDDFEGITHVLRSNEYRDRDAQYHLIQEDMGVKKKVCFYEFSRLNMVYTPLSKRKLLYFVQNGKVDGWDDPRLPTLQGMLRRGLKIEALHHFIREQGASANQNLMEWDKLWSINKKIIDPVCPRHTAVLENRVMITLTNGPEEPYERIIPRHKKYKEAGDKRTLYTENIWIDYDDAKSISPNEEVTLMDWGNAIIKEIKTDKEGAVVHLIGVLHLAGSVKATKLKLTWLPVTDALVRLKLIEFKYHITKKTLPKFKGEDAKRKEEEEFLKAIKTETSKETMALGDSNMQNLKRGEIIQLERKGYFRCDVPFSTDSAQVVLFAIPDGRKREDEQ